MSGIWHELVNDIPQSHFERKTFQGVGPTSRDAKYEAVKSALISLERQMPGKSI